MLAPEHPHNEAAQLYFRRPGMLHATHHFAITETCLLVDTADIRSPVSRTPITMEKLNR
jgi:hypothetical protein